MRFLEFYPFLGNELPDLDNSKYILVKKILEYNVEHKFY